MTVKIKPSIRKTTDMEITNLEEQLECRVPAEYKQFLLDKNGGIPESNEFNIPSVKNDSGVNRFYGIESTRTDGDLLYEQQFLASNLQKHFVAIAHAEGGNRILLSLRQEDYGYAFFWDHELEHEKHENEALFYLSSSFNSFLALLQPFDPENVQLKPGQVMSAWIDPEFLKSLNREDKE